MWVEAELREKLCLVTWALEVCKQNLLMTQVKPECHLFKPNVTMWELPHLMCLILLACTKITVCRLCLRYVHIKVDPVVCIRHIRSVWEMVGKNLALLYLTKMFQWKFFLALVSVFTIYFSVKDIFRSDTWSQGAEKLCSFLKKVRLLDSFIWSTLVSVGTV